MDFLIGLSATLLLAPFFILVVYLMRILPAEFLLGAVALMFLGDGVIGAIFYYIGSDFIESVKHLKLGLACSFVIATIFKVIYMILNQNKVLLILENNK
jgi:branched-subunit amino acid transport protein